MTIKNVLTYASLCIYNMPMSEIINETQCLQKIDALFDIILFKVLSEPIRVEILKHLAIVIESDVNGITEHFDKDQSVISRHLKMMQEAGILSARKVSRHTIYSINGKELLSKFEAITALVRELVENDLCE